MEPNAPITWQALEYHHEKKSIDWFWATSIIMLCIAITAVIYGDVLFAIVIIIGGGSLLIYAARVPILVNFELNEKGVLINRKLYLYSSLESFWVEENLDAHPHPKILIRSKKLVVPLIVIPIAEVEPDEIRQFLRNYLPEEEQYEPLSQRVMEYLGF